MKLALQVDKTVFIEVPTRNVPKDFEKFIKGYLEFFAKKVIERIREVVRRQLYTWEPLSDSYVAFKKRMGLDPRTWIASKQLVESITYFYVPLGDQWIIGVPPAKKYRKYKKGGGYDSSKIVNVRMIDVIRYLEFGTEKMPGRPLFTKVLNEFKPKKVQTKVYQEYLKTQKGLI